MSVKVMETLNKKSILEMGHGAFMEVADYGMGKVLDDIMDPNTEAKSPRTLTITFKFKPNEQRTKVAVECTPKLSLGKMLPLSTILHTMADRDTGEARQGVAIKAMVAVKPRVPLRPFRTFQEVEQPESEFLLRLDEDGNIGLFEADGGMWRLTARQTIKAFLEAKLADLVASNAVYIAL